MTRCTVKQRDGTLVTLRFTGPNTGQGPPPFYAPPPPGPPPPQGYVPPHYQTTQYTPVMSPPLAQPSPPPLYGGGPQQQQQQKSERHHTPRHLLRGGGGGGKYHTRPPHQQQQQQQQQNKSGNSSLHSTPPLSPRKELLSKKNGGGGEEESTTGEEEKDGGGGGGGEEQQQQPQQPHPHPPLQKQLSNIKAPKVVNLTAHEAMLQWLAPELITNTNNTNTNITATVGDGGGEQQQQQQQQEQGGGGGGSGRRSQRGGGRKEVVYEVFLNSSLHTSLPDTHITITALKPATEYRVHVQCVCGSVRGDNSPVTSFQTHSTIPDAPQLPRMVHKAKTSLQFRWCQAKENGSRVTAYVLEVSGSGVGVRPGEWCEVFRGRVKQHTISKLQPNTRYRVRLAAINEHGSSPYSPESVAFTSGLAPLPPSPPTLEEASPSSVCLAWVRRPIDDTFTLQMDDAVTGYGFRAVYNGRDTRFNTTALRRNTDYKFRLCAHNDEGQSPYSEIACYSTLPDHPLPPSAPTVKGRPRPTKLTLSWTPPQDHGGAPISGYRLELDRGSGFECVYNGGVTDAECVDLTPGRTYRGRVLCVGPGGVSEWSEVGLATTEAVCPGVCHPPRLLGKPKASLLQLKWSGVEYDGGAAVTEYHIEMLSPDSDRRQVYAGRDLECTVASLLPGRPYIFLVRGVNRVGAGPWSEPLEAVSGAGPPDAPHTPHPATRGPHLVHLAWAEPINNGATIEQYTVQMAEVSCPHAESSESSSTCGDSETDLTFSGVFTGPATTTEVRGLSPATTYAFRVSCSNSAGSGPWSPHATVTTPAAPPAPPAYISSSPAATHVTLLWGEPPSHGDPITHYVIEAGDKTTHTPGPDTEYTINDLLPETLYRIRIQGVNSVGAGPFSGVHKVTTRALPPAPPSLELVKASHNCLKVRWGDGKNLDLLTYSLQMEFPNPHHGTKEFYQVYSGTSQSYKVVRLEENTEYRLRICASNEAGTGPYSPIACLSTTKAPPPPLKAPRVSESGDGKHTVEWCSVRCPGEDTILYRLQLLHAGKDQDYSVVYIGSDTTYSLTHLEASSGYYVRVCGVRQCGDGETMAGTYSSPALFNTPKPIPSPTTKTHNTSTQEVGLKWHRLNDQQKAAVILVAFSLFCAVAAIVLNHFLPTPPTTPSPSAR
ncbi:hypothetical protein Pmani_001253 [Petrolisthes manimaculis]|uniref:Fibronectin type-III domain-containing protein n=1 Tax=Petrolisthes manimaculis TaxID=1843537 RepID=A0AAE1QNF9_9EUCA|nr:hypothetical protein Pmani_001253 [Petrolisthes manimaculis]